MTGNHAARRRFFDTDPGNYEQARPGYPARVYQLLEQHCGLRVGSKILEVGAGTGQATAELLRRGATVTAVEPGAQLAARLAARFAGAEMDVVVDDLENAELPDDSFDIACAATSFHWVDTAVALPKLARILRPGGWLAVWWTVFGDPQEHTPFRDALNRLHAEYLPGEQRDTGCVPGPMRTDSWIPELEHDGWFGPAYTELIHWTHQLTGQGARRLFASFPNVGELEPQRRAEFLTAVEHLVNTDFDGCVGDPYVTAVYLLPATGQHQQRVTAVDTPDRPIWNYRPDDADWLKIVTNLATGIGLTYGAVAVTAHNPQWLDLGARLCAEIRHVLGPHSAGVEHVGSTAVPGMPAKPIIDIAVAVTSATADDLTRRLESHGWIYRGDKGSDGGWLFVLETSPGVRAAHLHAVVHQGPGWRNYLLVRDRLRSDPALALAYGHLKQQLARQHPGDRAAYTKAKADFVAAIVA